MSPSCDSNCARWNSSGELMLYGRLPTTRSAGPERREVEFERVGDVQGQLPGRKLGREPLREVAVDLDRGEMPGTLDERPRQRGEPGSDLDQIVAGLRRDGVDDPRDVMRIGQEILAEAAPWLVFFHLDVHRVNRGNGGRPRLVRPRVAAVRDPPDERGRSPASIARARPARSRDPPRRTGCRDPRRAPLPRRRRGRAPCRDRPRCE